MRTRALRGWEEIAAYLRLDSIRAAQNYERELSLPIHRPAGGGPRAPVYAFPEELDDWVRYNLSENRRISPSKEQKLEARDSNEVLLARLLDEVLRVRGTVFYRRKYFLRFELRKMHRGTRARIECEFPLYNATEIKQPFTQEVTIDDRDRKGWVEELSILAGDKPLYSIIRPAISQKLRGYSVYHAPKAIIEPIATGIDYVCKATWFEYHDDNEIWPNHMIMPTIGIELVTTAPPEFDITPSFSSSQLLLVAQHLDVGWNRRT